MIKKNIIVLLFFVQGFYLFATAQAPDLIIYNGNEYPLFVNPMEIYFEKFPEKRPRSSTRSTALWRGYIATFEIIQNELWVVDIKIEVITSPAGSRNFTKELVSVINEVFDGNDRIKADWFSGLLIIPQGRIIRYEHMGYASTYEGYIILEIHNGNFIKELNLSYNQFVEFRERQFELYRQTEEYRELVEQIRNYSKEHGIIQSDEEIEDFLKIYLIDFIERIYE
ncbi:MAG: hypothetical protein FWD28_01170 [Treponema sp.]|nr:hypothetical protein [Treponema sp.]